MKTFEIVNNKFYSSSFFNEQNEEVFDDEFFVLENFVITVFDESENGSAIIDMEFIGKTKPYAVKLARSVGYNLTRQDISKKNIKVVKTKL